MSIPGWPTILKFVSHSFDIFENNMEDIMEFTKCVSLFSPWTAVACNLIQLTIQPNNLKGESKNMFEPKRGT